jgi:hypothetical protein
MTAFWGTLFQLAINPFTWMEEAMEGVGERVGQMMETEAGWEPEEEGPKRRTLSMDDLRKKYPWWPSNGVSKGSSAFIEMEPLHEDGEAARGVKNTKL